MSSAPKKEDARHVQHAVTPRQTLSPRSRPVMVPNRLFTSHIKIIIKNRTKEAQKSAEFSRCDELEVRELAASSPDSSQVSRRSPYIDGIQDQEEMCDVLVDGSEPLDESINTEEGENFDETIEVTIERDDVGLTPVSTVTDLTSLSPDVSLSKSTSFGNEDYGSENIDDMNNNESPKKRTCNSRSKSRKDSKSCSREECKCSSKSREDSKSRSREECKSSCKSRKDSKSRSREECKSISKSRKDSKSRSREECKSSCKSRKDSKSCSREESHESKKKRSEVRHLHGDYTCTHKHSHSSREKSSSRHQKHQASSKHTDSFRSSLSKTETNEKEETVAKVELRVKAEERTCSRQYSNCAGALDQSPDNCKLIKSTEIPKQSPAAYSECSVVKPLQKMSSSETHVDVPGSSESEDEQIIDHKIFTVSDKNLYSSYSSLSSQSDSTCSKSSDIHHSSASFGPSPDQYIQLRPDTQYRMPVPTTPGNNPNAPLYPGPTIFPLSFYANTPPPPLMLGGVFQWAPYSDSASISSPNLLIDQMVLIPPTSVVEKRFQQLQNLHDPPRPSFHGYQLVGDSMLLRFSQKILKDTIIYSESLRFLGFCVSGQKIGELLKRLKNGFYHLGKKVVVMIGTNDLLRNTQLSQMCAELQKVVDYLCARTDEVVLLTLPPIPRLENMTYHWCRLDGYNKFIKELGMKESKLLVLDVSPLYVLNEDELQAEELMAEYNAKTLFCQGCLTCLEESEDYDMDFSSQSNGDEISETALLTHTYVSTIPQINTVDISGMFMDRRVPKCRMDCFETFFADSSRKDLIHLNLKGLQVVQDELYKVI